MLEKVRCPFCGSDDVEYQKLPPNSRSLIVCNGCGYEFRLEQMPAEDR